MSKLDRFKRPHARSSRADTDAEQVLWDNLDCMPVEGTHFRRQVEIGPYRADIALLGLKLLIEVDGPIHDHPEELERDRRRDNWLANEGYRVIRFSNHDVTTDMNSVLRAIELAMAEQERALQHPTPALPRRPSPSRGG